MKEKDGRFFACTELKDAEAVKEKIEGMTSTYGSYPYREGMRLQYMAVYDLTTSDLLGEEEWIVEEDGTEGETTRECTVPRGTGIKVYRNSEAASEFFTNAECTQPYTGGGRTDELHLYVK
jgi:hypothetical protein